MDANEFQRIKKKVENLKQEKSRAEGALDEQKRVLKESFGCDSIEAARSKLAELKQNMDKAKIEYENVLASFKDQFGDLL